MKRNALLIGVVVVFSVLGVLVLGDFLFLSSGPPVTPDQPTAENATPPSSAWASTGCVDNSSGWLVVNGHTVGHGPLILRWPVRASERLLPANIHTDGSRSYDRQYQDGQLIFHATIPHDLNETVRPTVEQAPDDVLELHLQTGEQTKAPPKNGSLDCEPGSTVHVTTTLPSGTESIAVFRDGARVTTIDTADAEMPIHRHINTTTS